MEENQESKPLPTIADMTDRLRANVKYVRENSDRETDLHLADSVAVCAGILDTVGQTLAVLISIAQSKGDLPCAPAES